MPPERVTTPILWIDIETGGLLHEDTILEIGVVITTPKLEPYFAWSSAIRQDRELLRMSAWAWEQHTKSGLLSECFYSGTHDRETALGLVRSGVRNAFINLKVPLGGPMETRPIVAGANVGSFDRPILRRNGWGLDDLLHYRCIDVSTLREVARMIWPGVELPLKSEHHRVMQDIEASIECARWFFKRAGQVAV